MGGGRHHAFAQENTLEATPTAYLRDVLEAYIRKHIPKAAAYLNHPGWQHWAGIMGMSRQKKPIVAQLQPGMWASLACNGMGVALTPMVGRQVAAKLMDYLGSPLY
jgi:glycine/D-amino acid oxidase-like deaminating enzyme